jgi:diaminopimelate decarboxylase
VPVRGIHFNTGLHPLDAGPYRRVLRNWRTLLQDLRKEAAEPLMVDIGGGFPAASCAPGTQLPHWSTYAAAVAAECRALGLPPEDLHLVIEPGRSLVEDHAVLVTSVAVKKERDRRHVVVVDAGTNLARSISGWHHTVEFLDPGDVQYDIYGSMCYESDQFQRRVLGPPVLRAGDRVLIGAVGGYDIPSANIWVRHRPAIYALSDAGNEFTCLRGPSAEIR